MELQWPLIIFTMLTAWSAGIFASQCGLMLATLRTGSATASTGMVATSLAGAKAQMVAWACAAALLVAGGVAVFFHLEHWERIFNGFGHLTSGITQEFVVIVILAAVAVAYLATLRKGEGRVPAWLAVTGIATSVALVAIVAHSYTMAARPAWNSILWILAMLGEACVLGPCTVATIVAACGGDLSPIGMPARIGAAVNSITTVAFAVFLQLSGGFFPQVGYYFDPTHPTKAMANVTSVVDAQTALVWVGAVAIGALVPLVAAFLAKRKGNASSWRLWGTVAVAAALAGAFCIRIAFYNLGFSIFMFY